MSRRVLAVVAVCLGAIALGVDAAPAQAPAPPINDNYLSSLELNQRGTKLNSTDTLVDHRNTTSATVQTDLFTPPNHGGPPEPTSYHGVSYGKTIWYDFYPNKNGVAQIQTAGFDNVICVYTFSTHTLLPDIPARRCVHQSSAPAEELLVKVKAGVAYTIQIGGVNDAGGELQLQFDYIPAPPVRLSASSTLKAVALNDGVQILALNVSAPRASHIKVRCSDGCRSETKRGGNPSFPGLDGTVLTAGSQLQIFVTEANAIGAYIQYDITDGDFNKISRCLEPGSMTPRRSCH
jgi:hypothetical protein